MSNQTTRTPAPVKDLSGFRCGRLVVQSFAEKRGQHRYWKCLCNCGNEKVIREDALRGRRPSLSCGCLQAEKAVELGRRCLTTHGLCDRPESVIWHGLTSRCFSPNNAAFDRYGGRGITVCERWRGPYGFANFLSDMGPRPSPAHSIERIDNNGNYEPTNCVWATSVQQGRNKRNNHVIEYNGESLCLSAWAERLGIQGGTLLHRIRSGWPIEKALTTPVDRRRWRKAKRRDS